MALFHLGKSAGIGRRRSNVEEQSLVGIIAIDSRTSIEQQTGRGRVIE